MKMEISKNVVLDILSYQYIRTKALVEKQKIIDLITEEAIRQQYSLKEMKKYYKAKLLLK
jgi:hypothetical protein